MTLMSFLLLIILFLAFFIYFSGLNPQEITVFYLPGQSVTHSVALVLVSCILVGLAVGYLVYLYGTVTHLFKHWKRDRHEKKAREVAAIYREGVNRLLSGDLKKAHSLLQRALDRDASRVETYIAMASVHLQEGDAQEGVSLLRRAREIEPKSLEVLFKLASTYEEMKLDDEATKTYKGILDLEGSNRKALRSLRDIHMKQGGWREALDLQRRLLKVVSGSRRAEEEKQKLFYLRYEVARVTMDENNLDQAKGELRDIVKEAPDFVPARVTLGDVLRAQGRAEEAAQVWQEGYQACGRGVFLARLEDLCMAAEDPSTLLSFYRNALLEKGDDLMLRLFYGKFCLRLEMVDEAMEQLHQVESAGIDTPHLHLLLAEAQRRRTRVDEAIREYKKAIGLDSRLRLSYRCDACGEEYADWQSRCGECGAWGSLSILDRRSLSEAKAVRAPVMREIYHGERGEWPEQ